MSAHSIRAFDRAHKAWTPIPALRPVETPVRLPNQAWVTFLSGSLTADDWALIARVEAGEISVDDAMRGITPTETQEQN